MNMNMTITFWMDYFLVPQPPTKFFLLLLFIQYYYDIVCFAFIISRLHGDDDHYVHMLDRLE